MPKTAEKKRAPSSLTPNIRKPARIIQYMNGGLWAKSSSLYVGTIQSSWRCISAAAVAKNASSTSHSQVEPSAEK